ncbi:retropepsin-like aspartic protease family protein [Tranquillimonas alkanivorans]|uniref:Aspartyl protease family protein n=1 Tax=Tranquillimonas alkanivorans TaxID=441119 RepID=A0A1I5QLW5_9RHOB|nr:TIGR02281 family clan AA aspartic protease [Tranquillimonas alkanivorans]SFP47021.1 aspartyl protease family protein [Tranquillimonas alkanivorans]
MTGDQIAQFLYLALLGAAVGGYFVAANRRQLGRMAQQAMIWAMIFLGTVAAIGLWNDVRDDVVPRQSYLGERGAIAVPRAFDGHYYLTAEINGAPVDFVVDTGATDMVLTREDAMHAGIDPARLAFIGQARTANGTVPIARVMLDTVELGSAMDLAVAASVNGGEMGMSLMGMSYLDRFSRIEIADDRMILHR